MELAVPDSLNLVKNPRFADGKRTPRTWQWIAEGPEGTWRRVPSANGEATRMEIAAKAPVQAAADTAQLDSRSRYLWAQRIRCSGDTFYRVEVTVEFPGVEAAAVEFHEPGGNVCSPGAGVVLAVQPMRAGEPVGDPMETPPFLTGRGTLRAYCRTPKRATMLELRIGVRPDCRRAILREVLMMPILEPDLTSHPVAIPPPPMAYPAPRRVKKIGLCGPVGDDAPLVRILRGRFGADAVRLLKPGDLRAVRNRQTAAAKVDAIILTGSPPSSMRTITAVAALAQHHLLVLTPSVLAGVARNAVEVRTIRQKDDPLCATVHEANFITRGFALRDCLPFAARGIDGADPRIFVQPQFRTTREFGLFCKKQGFVTVLRSETDADASSGKPVCLFKAAPGGGVVVMDLAPIESEPSSLQEPSLALYLLLNALGAEQSSLGQYSVPAWSHREFWEQLLDFEQRFEQFVIEGLAPPYREGLRPRIHLGRRTQTLGLPLVERPWIVVRSGLSGEDTEGIYGAMNWIKSLVLPVPYASPYAVALAARYRLTWHTLHAAWPRDIGWRRTAGDPVTLSDCIDDGNVAMAVDVTNTHRNHIRVMLSSRSPLHDRLAEALPPLWRALMGSRYFSWCPREGASLSDQRKYDWRWHDLVPRVCVDEAAFDGERVAQARRAGTDLVRIETPSSPASVMCNSVWQTDRVATLLELIVGLRSGIIAMNRRQSSLQVPIPTTVTAGGAPLYVARTKSNSDEVEARVVSTPYPPTVKLAPGEALCQFLDVD